MTTASEPWIDPETGQYSEEHAEAERKRLRALTLEQRITDRRTYDIEGWLVRVDVVNDLLDYRWRIGVQGEEPGAWSSHYEDIATVEHKGLVFGYLTEYWSSPLPIETPFLIVPGQPVDD